MGHSAARLLSAFAALSIFATAVPAAEYGPQDHGGAVLTLADGDVIWGLHTGIGAFAIPAGATVKVRSYDGSDAATGTVDVRADTVMIAGVLDASGSGYTGGGGGGHAGWTVTGLGGGTGAGSGGQSAYPGHNGFGGLFGEVGPFGGYVRGGNGGDGDGPLGGDGGVPSLSVGGNYLYGQPGGYAIPFGNGDTTTDNSIRMGSGGGGHPGTSYETGDSTDDAADGIAGGRGGGSIAIVAGESLTLAATARILANGRFAAGKNVEPTFDFSVAETGPLRGPGGAGGGILLSCTNGPVTFAEGSAVRSRGTYYPDRDVNGGTVKIFRATNDPGNLPEIEAGRVFTTGAGPVVGWMLR